MNPFEANLLLDIMEKSVKHGDAFRHLRDEAMALLKRATLTSLNSSIPVEIVRVEKEEK